MLGPLPGVDRGNARLALDYRALQRALVSKAEAYEDRSGGHIGYYRYALGKRRLVTVVSHGARGQIPKWLLGRMARQMRLTSRQLGQFVDCTMSREEWVEVWESGVV